jgi:hypothetical protein
MDDSTILRMVEKCLELVRPAGAFHVIDPILPLEADARIKRWIFLKDRGRHQRTLEGMTTLLSRCALIEAIQVREDLMHDVSYFRLRRGS